MRPDHFAATMRWRAIVCLGLLTTLVCCSGSKRPSSPTSSVVELTELNFDSLVSGKEPWIIDVYAPWCPACKDLVPVWESLAVELYPEVHVGKIDGTVEHGLLTRFAIPHFPAIYHLNGTETREFEGLRTVKLLAHFAREGWRDVPPRTGCRSPISTCGRLLGRLSRIPLRVRQYYKYLHEQRQFSDLTLVAALLAVPVVIGMSLICLVDAYYTRRPLAQLPRPHHD